MYEFQIGSYAILENACQNILGNVAENKGARSNLDYLCHL